MSRLNARGAALVIGSLFWDNRDGRDHWRKLFLIMNKRIKVYLPIQYWRYSTKRNCYTMVFTSSSIDEKDMGTGYAIPHASITKNAENLYNTAILMANAEGMREELVTKWGMIELMINPYSKYVKELEEAWVDIVCTKSTTMNMGKPFTGDPKLQDLKHQLFIPWPKKVEDNQPLSEFDYLFAASNLPKHHSGLTKIPLPEEVTQFIRPCCKIQTDTLPTPNN